LPPELSVPEFSMPDLAKAQTLSAQLAGARAEVDRLKAELELLRDQDPLTGLPNRVRLADRTGQAVLLARRDGAMVAMVLVELDRFKAVNQTLDFAQADNLILELSVRMKHLLAPEDTLARLGTDQFAVLLPEVRDPAVPLRLAQRLLDALVLPVRLGGRDVRLTASLGISVSPQDGDDAAELLREAESAANRAKASGGNGIQCTTLTLSEAALERQQLEASLGSALGRDELEVWYQPQVDAEGRILGMEALLRWHHPVLGPVPPAKFIPLAEENHLIHALGEWILTTACRQAVIWQALSRRPLKLAVNVSPLQLAQPRLLSTVASILRDTRLPASCLELELTEGALVRAFRPGLTPLHELKAMGVGIGIDDFGTGYSSLGYLQRFPIDTLKIDRSFVQGMFPSQPDAVSSLPIVQTIMNLGQNLGLTLLAEGVELPTELEALKAMGCRIFQGYLTGRPMPAASLSALLEAQADTDFQALLPP